MEASCRVVGLGVEILNQSNYKVWKSYLESYLIGEDLWDVVGGGFRRAPTDTPENREALKRWRTLNAKAEFVLKRSISHDLFEHIIGCKSVREIWETLDGLMNKKNNARLQLLENELANTIQGAVKRNIIRGLNKEYHAFITSIQGWQRQPSLVEFENLLASQELLARQMAGCSISGGNGEVLFAGNKKGHNREEKKKDHKKDGESTSNGERKWKKVIKCYRCGKLGISRRTVESS
uniref:Uncharacterized protein n=1 Tax=Ananas comosus var. bracteatus TaxID=296719 RepID=A0A6V7Q0C4_ANACO|nr:unnamed protein product [Ananas comosus var. bracteatus]